MPAETTQKPIKLLLLETGARLAQEQGSAVNLNLVQVRATAQVSVAAFSKVYADGRQYLLALMLHFLDQARAEAIEVIARSATGVPRIAAAFECYWDANLRCRPMRELAIHFRADPEGAEILRLRLTGVVVIAQHELKSVGWPFPAATARLAGNMCVETAIAEYEAKARLPDMRAAVLAYFRDPPPRFSPVNAIP